MSPEKWFVIVNPGAGSVDDVSTLEKALDRLPSFEMKETQGAGDAINLAREALDRGITRIAAAGGDGTLNEVVNGVAERLQQVTLGLLPLGTGNDFANSLELPREPEQAIEVLARGQTREVDLIRLRNRDLVRYFLNTSAGGFTTAVDDKLTPESKERLGALAFYVAAARALPDLQEYELRIKFDQQEPMTVGAYNIIVANGRTMGGGVPVAPEARLDDGLMDVLILPAIGIVKLTSVVSQLLLGKHLGSPDVITRQARTMTVSSNPSLTLNVDGEIIGEAPAFFDVVPKALRVVC